MAGTDFRLTAGRLSFAAGQISNSFSVPILDNSVVQFDRTLALLLFNPEGGATLGLSNSVLVIVEDDLLVGRINFARTNFSVVENGGSATIWVSRMGGSAGAVSIDYLTSGGNAVAGVDYTTTTGVLSWASSESGPKMFMVPVVDNGLVDGLREARLILTNASVAGAIGVTNEARLAIADDDAYGTLSFSRASYLANENGGNALVTIVRQGGVAEDVFVGARTVVGGTAIEGTNPPANYSASTTNLNLAPGQTSASFLVRIIDNTSQDGGATVNLELFSPTNATLGTRIRASILIVDDELFSAAAGSLDSSYEFAGADNIIYALALQADGALVLGGDFRTINNLSVPRLTRLDPSGLLDPTFGVGLGPDAAVRALAIHPVNPSGPNGLNAGRIVVGGVFTNFNNVLRQALARLNTDGSLDLTFNPGEGPDGAVYAIAV